VTLDRDGSVLVSRDAIVERLRNVPSGLEQSWEVAERPRSPIPGPLVFRTRAEGMTYTGHTAQGHHWVDAATGRGIRYGNATWVDARGTRTPVEVAREGSDLVMAVSESVLDGTTFPAVLDPTIGPELGVDTPVPGRPPLARAVALAPGANGEWLAAWLDYSDGAYDFAVHARRIAANGALAGTELLLPLGPADPCVAFDSTTNRWLVASLAELNASAVRVDATGAVLDAKPIALGTSSYYDTCSAAFDGTKFRIVGTDTDALKEWDLSTAGAILPPSPLSLSPGGRTPKIACIPSSSCLAAWADGSAADVHAALRDANGAAIGSPVLLTANGGAVFDVATDGTQYLVTWEEASQLRSARVSTTPAVLDVPSLLVASAQPSGAASGWDGQNFVVVEGGASALTAQRIAPNGSFVGAPVTLAAEPRVQPALATTAGASYLAWIAWTAPFTSLFSTDRSAYGSRLASPPSLLDGAGGTTLIPRQNAETRPRLAWNGSVYLLVWEDTRASSGDVYALRLSKTGTPLAATATQVGSGGSLPVVASDGSDFLVAWTTSGQAQAARVSGTTGAVLDMTPITLPGRPFRFPAITFNGESYVVVWSDEFAGGGLTRDDLYGVRISKAGTLLDANGFIVAGTSMREWAPSLASNGTDVFAVWEATPNYGDIYVRGTRITRAGAVLDPDGVPIGGSMNEAEPVVTWSGNEYTVAWGERVQGNDDAMRLRGARVTTTTTAAVVLEPNGIVLAQGHGFGHTPDIIPFDTATSFIAWSDSDTASGPVSIRGLRVRRAPFESIDAAPFPLVTEPGTSRAPSLAPGDPGSVLLAYQRFDPALQIPRAHTRSITTKPIGGSCGGPLDCASAYCKDGVCCESACTGKCQTCAGGGKCTPVTSAPDPDSCSGTATCDATGTCRRANGQVCTVSGDCASAFCVDGVCCESACNDPCSTCTDEPGKCLPSVLSSPGRPSCAPARCNGQDLACPARCDKDEECADGYGCDSETGQCVAGALCANPRTARAPNRVLTDCTPYLCRGGACSTRCESITDCAFPAVCDEAHRCVTAPAEPAGACAMRAPTRPRPGEVGLVALAALGALAARRRRAR
jgi:hypothetical protein